MLTSAGRTDLHEHFSLMVWGLLMLARLQAQESMFAQSQTSVQELTSQLRDRCLELRELSLKEHEQEKLLNVRTQCLLILCTEYQDSVP